MPIIKHEIVVCYRCGRFIMLNANVRTKTGKRIPLDNLTERKPHVCEVAA